MPSPLKRSWGESLNFAFKTLPGDMAGPFLLGVTVSALVTIFVPQGFFAEHLPGGFLSYLVMSLIGIPIYTCSIGAIPIAAGLIYSGVSPGAALVFLISGPATSAITILTVWKAVGRAACLCHIAAILTGAWATGFALDKFFPEVGEKIVSAVQCCDSCAGSDWPLWICAAVLAALFANAATRKYFVTKS